MRKIAQREEKLLAAPPAKIRRTLAREGPRQGMRTAVCPRLDRPARAPPHAKETRDEQHIGLENIRAKRVKKIKVFDIFDWMISIGRDPLYL